MKVNQCVLLAFLVSVQITASGCFQVRVSGINNESVFLERANGRSPLENEDSVDQRTVSVKNCDCKMQ